MEKPVQTNDMSLEASVKSRPKLVFLSWSENCGAVEGKHIPSYPTKNPGLQKLQLLFASHGFWRWKPWCSAIWRSHPKIGQRHTTQPVNPLPFHCWKTDGFVHLDSDWIFSDLRRKRSDHQLGQVSTFSGLIKSGWWFGTWLWVFHSVGNVIIPTDDSSIIFQRGRSTTNQIIINHH